MTKKYELTDEVNLFGLHRVRYLRDLPGINKGELGGWIEKEENLDQSGDALVAGDAHVFGNARVSSNAWVYGDTFVYDNARVYGDAHVFGNAQVAGDAHVFGNARVSGDADWMIVGPIGSRDGYITIFREPNRIAVVCVCFYGSLDEFAAQVVKTHGDNQHAKAYLAMIEMAKARGK